VSRPVSQGSSQQLVPEMPKIEVFIVPSKEKPTGVGEPGTPVTAPALANAILAMQGKPIRALPMSSQGVTFV
jgi:isoquinoline 1-oxidoreductase beta subunit